MYQELIAGVILCCLCKCHVHCVYIMCLQTALMNVWTIADALILSEMMHRALAAMLCSLVSHGFLTLLGKMPSMKGTHLSCQLSLSATRGGGE